MTYDYENKILEKIEPIIHEWIDKISTYSSAEEISNSI